MADLPPTHDWPGMPWHHVLALVMWLDSHNGTGPEEIALRLLKLTEEAGEAAQAYIGLRGQNPRKGITHTREDVATELCDVTLTALVALCAFTEDPAAFFDTAIRTRRERVSPSTLGNHSGGW
ncbi:MazG-like family protein [Streptomyces cinnamoneus]|uniref:MazG-like family protein n=1 Tax=Streptomyces cinnamoneus TaxID=53446 RepID=UPI0037A304BC